MKIGGLNIKMYNKKKRQEKIEKLKEELEKEGISPEDLLSEIEDKQEITEKKIEENKKVEKVEKVIPKEEAVWVLTSVADTVKPAFGNLETQEILTQEDLLVKIINKIENLVKKIG